MSDGNTEILLEQQPLSMPAKVLYGFFFVAAVTLYCLTASLPVNLPSNQYTDGLSIADSGSTAFMLAATAASLVFGPALAFLFAHFYGFQVSKFMKNILYIVSFITLSWIVLSFSLTYGSDANRDNILGYPKDYYMFNNVYSGAHELAPSIPISLFAIFELGFAILTSVVVFTGLYGRMDTSIILAFIFVWHFVIQTPIAHIGWNPHGFALINKVRDFAGGAVVAITAAATILAGETLLKLNKATSPAQSRLVSSKIVAPVVAVLFVAFLTIAGKAYAANGVSAQVFVNVIGAVATSFFTNVLIDKLFTNLAFNNVSVVNSILIGVIAALPMAGYLAVGGVMVVTAIIVFFLRLVLILSKEQFNLPLSVPTLFGTVGTVAFLLTAMFSYVFINPAGLNGLTYGEVGPIRHQLAALLAVWVVVYVASLLLFLILGFFFPVAKDTTEVEEKAEVVEDVSAINDIEAAN